MKNYPDCFPKVKQTKHLSYPQPKHFKPMGLMELFPIKKRRK